ncbi:MAG TPA: FeoC-like transcriptional regulator [Anaerovoracaceae bacterium]|nr:FeoC-like transcriptional regulator [Anaerovoracaceae bacterium]
MLKELLIAIKSSEYISKSDISKELKVSEELVEEGFEQLIRMGYIEEVSRGISCDIGCNSCPLSKSCDKMPIRTIIITEKGKRLLAK